MNSQMQTDQNFDQHIFFPSQISNPLESNESKNSVIKSQVSSQITFHELGNNNST